MPPPTSQPLTLLPEVDIDKPVLTSVAVNPLLPTQPPPALA